MDTTHRSRSFLCFARRRSRSASSASLTARFTSTFFWFLRCSLVSGSFELAREGPEPPPPPPIETDTGSAGQLNPPVPLNRRTLLRRNDVPTAILTRLVGPVGRGIVVCVFINLLGLHDSHHAREMWSPVLGLEHAVVSVEMWRRTRRPWSCVASGQASPRASWASERAPTSHQRRRQRRAPRRVRRGSQPLE